MDFNMIRFYLLGGAVLTAFLMLFLGIFIMIKNFKAPLNRNLFIACLGVVGWCLSAVHVFYNIYRNTPIHPFISFRLIWTCSIFIGFATLNFAFYYPPRSRFINGKREFLIFLIPSALAVLFIIGSADGIMRVLNGNGQMTVFHVRRTMLMDLTIRNSTLVNVRVDLLKGGILYAFPLLSTLLATILVLFRKYRIQPDIQGKNKLKLIGAGMLLTALLAWPFGNLLPMFLNNINFYGIALISPIIIFSFMAYSIIRYKALEIETIIHKTIMWFIVTSLVIIPIVLVIFPFYNYFIMAGPTLVTLLVVLFVYIFHEIHELIQPRINRLFERNRVDYGELFQRISQNILSASSTDVILNTVQENIVREIHSEFAFSMLMKLNYYYELSGRFGKMPADGIDPIHASSQLISLLDKEARVLEGVYVRNSPDYAAVRNEGFFSRYHVEVVVPYKFRDRLFGFLALGRKTNLKDYTNDEIKMFENLVKNAGLSLFNAENQELFVKNKLLERDLSIATDIQRSLLPTDTFSVEGLDIKAFTKPMSVGNGDYYDIKEISNDRILVLILDVSGKGVSAALVMVMIQTVFLNHILFYEDLSKLAGNINEVLLTRLKGEKFATAIFLEVNTKTGEARVLNCGHHPLLLMDPEKKLTRIGANSLPLGMMESLNEKVLDIKIPKGSLALLYTDGLAETKNSNAELFGETRITETALSNRDKAPDEIVKALFREAKDFAKEEQQGDDMTLIVVKKN
ncbi:MAG: SpoIIE family protein phosphatase [bacterium]|nr:SpoIIE family protein phosphatase [bacterium]